MTDTVVLEIALQAIIIAAKLCAPILLVTLGVGFGISLLQSVTQIQEVTLTFVPKLAGIGLVLAFGGHWMLSEMISYTTRLFDTIPALLQST